MATHSSTLAWRILWMEEPGPPWGRRVGHNWATSFSLSYMTLLAFNQYLHTGFFCKNIMTKWKSLSCVWLSATAWTVVYQASLSMGFSRQEYWSGLPFPSPGDLPDPGIKPRSPALQADTSPSEPQGKPMSCIGSGKRFEVKSVWNTWKAWNQCSLAGI